MTYVKCLKVTFCTYCTFNCAHACCGTLSYLVLVSILLCSPIPNLDFTENEIDGQAFCELSEDDVRLMTPKLGVVKKIYRLKTVM